MISKLIRDAFHNSMGTALDLARLTDIGERQLRQFSMSLKDRVNEQLVDLFSDLEESGLVRQCDCLKRILDAKEKNVEPGEMKRLYDKKANCQDCDGSGYVDTFSSIPPSEEDSDFDAASKESDIRAT